MTLGRSAKDRINRLLFSLIPGSLTPVSVACTDQPSSSQKENRRRELALTPSLFDQVQRNNKRNKSDNFSTAQIAGLTNKKVTSLM